MKELEQVVTERVQQITSHGELTLLTAQCMTLLTASKARQRELEEQGHIKRFFNNLSGKNGRLTRAISGDLVNAQLAAQHTMYQLAQRQVLTMDILCAMQQKVHQLQAENDLKFIQLFQLIEQVYDSSEQKLAQLQDRITKAENRIEVMNWYLTSRFKNYEQLTPQALVLTIVKDFYRATNGQWTDEDLLYIELLLMDLQVKQALSYAALTKEQALLKEVFQLVPMLPKNEHIYLTDAMQQLYNGLKVDGAQTFALRHLIHEILNTLLLITMLTRPVQTQYQVVFHKLDNPNNRIHVIRALHLEAGLSKEQSRDVTWSTEPAVIQIFDDFAPAKKLKRALEQEKCSVTIEEIDTTL